jgi:hypothetical protein
MENMQNGETGLNVVKNVVVESHLNQEHAQILHLNTEVVRVSRSKVDRR